MALRRLHGPPCVRHNIAKKKHLGRLLDADAWLNDCRSRFTSSSAAISSLYDVGKHGFTRHPGWSRGAIGELPGHLHCADQCGGPMHSFVVAAFCLPA